MRGKRMVGLAHSNRSTKNIIDRGVAHQEPKAE